MWIDTALRIRLQASFVFASPFLPHIRARSGVWCGLYGHRGVSLNLPCQTVLSNGCPQYHGLSKDYWDVKELRTMYKAKAVITGILSILSIPFGVTLYKGKTESTPTSTNVGGKSLRIFSLGTTHALFSAILEWVISFGFTL